MFKTTRTLLENVLTRNVQKYTWTPGLPPPPPLVNKLYILCNFKYCMYPATVHLIANTRTFKLFILNYSRESFFKISLDLYIFKYFQRHKAVFTRYDVQFTITNAQLINLHTCVIDVFTIQYRAQNPLKGPPFLSKDDRHF